MLVFGDDRLRSTREQRMLQVDLVRHSAGAGLVWGEDFTRVFTILYFKDFVNS